MFCGKWKSSKSCRRDGHSIVDPERLLPLFEVTLKTHQQTLDDLRAAQAQGVRREPDRPNQER